MNLMLFVLAVAAQQPAIDSAKAALQRAEREYEESLVELGEAALPDLEKLDEPIARKAVERVKSARTKIRELVEALGVDDVDAREKATEELLSVGRPARGALEAAAKGDDPERSARAQRILAALGTANGGTLRWAQQAVVGDRLVKKLEGLVASGLCPSRELDDARRRRDSARLRAGQISRREYLTLARKDAEQTVKDLEQRSAAGLVSSHEVVMAKLNVARLDRLEGKATEAEYSKIAFKAIEEIHQRVEEGLMTPEEAVIEQAELLADPDPLP